MDVNHTEPDHGDNQDSEGDDDSVGQNRHVLLDPQDSVEEHEGLHFPGKMGKAHCPNSTDPARHDT
jgi:hypothetical protein